MMVAKAIGTIAMILLRRNDPLKSSATAKTLVSRLKGKPIHAASFTLEKSTSPIAAARA